jgi:hypothetical protein
LLSVVARPATIELFTNIQGSPAGRDSSISVCTSTPSTADTTNTARSATRKAAATSPTKSAYPGVSRTFTLWSSCSNGAIDIDTEIPRRPSSGSKSETVLPSSTRPILGMAPVTKRRPSARLVLPDPP